MKQKSRLRKPIIGMLALLIAVAVAAAGASIYERRRQAERDKELAHLAATVENTTWTDDNTVMLDGDLYGFDHRIETFLFVGTDASGNESATGADYHGAMADFLLLAVLDHTQNSIGYLQIDRNTITEVRELYEDGRLATLRDLQICTAHWYGHDPEMSAENTVTAVRMLLGELENINGYYVVNMKDIGQINRAVGGVEVTIDEDLTMVDSAFTKGTTLTLTDEQAERYVRARRGVGDEDNAARMVRQRRYMDGLLQKVKQLTTGNPKYGNELWKMLRHIAVTNMNGNAFSRMAQKMLKGEDKGILRLRGETRLGDVLDDGKEHEEFYPDVESIRDTMTELFSLVLVESAEEGTEPDEDDDALYEDSEDDEEDEAPDDEEDEAPNDDHVGEEGAR